MASDFFQSLDLAGWLQLVGIVIGILTSGIVGGRWREVLTAIAKYIPALVEWANRSHAAEVRSLHARVNTLTPEHQVLMVHRFVPEKKVRENHVYLSVEDDFI